MNPSGSEKTERGSLPEGGGTLRGTGPMTAHDRGISLICHGTKSILRVALTEGSTERHKLGPKENRFNPRQA